MAEILHDIISSYSKRYGRCVLAKRTSTDVLFTDDYRFWTLQASGIQIPFLKVTKRDTATRLDAVNKVRKLVAPNYVITTGRLYSRGKIWAFYLNQKQYPDYTLSNASTLRSTSDTDVYTRVVTYGKNKSPENIMLREGVQFIRNSEAFSGQAVEVELVFSREQDTWYIYESSLTEAGRILATPRPVVFINGVPINGETVELNNQPVRVLEKQTITTEAGK